MYIPTIFNDRARRTPLYEDARLYEDALNRGLLSKIMFILRSLSRG